MTATILTLVTSTILLAIILPILKIASVISLSWWWIMPMIVIAVILFIVIGVVLYVAFIVNRKG